MVMFEFLKKLFREKEKKEISVNGKGLSFLEIERWIGENRGEATKQFKEKVDSGFLLIETGSKDIEAGLNELENFNIEREINERAKTMILQNKDNYIRSTKRLLDFFNNGIKTERNVKKIDDFVKLAMWEVDLFTRQTTRSFQISSSIIGKEFERILIGLKKISKAIVDLKTMDKTDERMIETIINILDSIKNDEKIVEKFECIQKENNDHINALKETIDSLKNKEKSLQASKEWKHREELREKIDKFEKEQEQERAKLRNLFMNIEKVIQKYAWNRKKKDVLMYIEDTISALREDDGLKVLEDLDEIIKDIEENVYTNDNERKIQFLENVNKIDELVLLNFLEKDMKYDEDLSKLRDELKEIKIEELNYEDLNGKIGERDEENLKIEKKKKIILEEIYSKKKKVSLLLEDLGQRIERPIKVGL
ncbi:MAG: hypothetical protein KKE23_00080 [Nanoarchaeota archaeon]|nr:hypothetical protein [Nanoarchaeota archaeon]